MPYTDSNGLVPPIKSDPAGWARKLTTESGASQRAAMQALQLSLSRSLLASEYFSYMYIMTRGEDGLAYFPVDAQRPEEETPRQSWASPIPKRRRNGLLSLIPGSPSWRGL